ncbi:isopentenyl-diphosphate delta-isomerase [Mangrovactinospora gilvigrisea]|uniref:Isopentenyl-diphosphate Delta-isomerase n=1 Tax=Mangrovactinospora gilvigrisea TaxID=1428644 RepID=A0A1J7C842_9ACTN|nr:isopentenyl-diphosphate Delta-isomerase [Mangrovactinospora gilvigrisea]OIV35810.1 isopentenyl-diphosphate delta-isomerase [Mangrovactinospora gilvigrisea]
MTTDSTSETATAAEIMLELVDDAGRTIGTAEKLSAHLPPGRPHRAFSVFLFDTRGRMLLQRRAMSKYHSPGVWSNTCCGHPYPNEAPIAAAARRTYEELGAAPNRIEEGGTVRYDLPDPASGLIEREFNHLFVGTVDAAMAPDPDEVEDTRFVTAAELAELREAPGSEFSVWFPTVLDAALPAIRRLTGAW